MSFYRTYRPQTIEELDTKAVREYVLSLLKKDKSMLPHAYLLTGPKGTGKTTTARLIAKIFNCEKPSASGEPCGNCEQCKSIARGQHLDVREIDAASNTGVDNIRELRDSIALTPSTGTFAVYIIDEAHMLSSGAFNALLKTLEEPPSHAIFILATTEPQKIPATILSRCVRLQFLRAQSSDIKRALERIVLKEKLKIDADALSLIVEHADGSYRDAVKNLEQMSLSGIAISRSNVETTLAYSHDTLIREYIETLTSENLENALKILRVLQESGTDVKIFMSSCLQMLEQDLVTKALNHADVSILLRIIERLMNAYGDLRISPIQILPLEIASIELCCSTPPTKILDDILPPVVSSSGTPTSQVILEKVTPKAVERAEHVVQENELLSLEKLSECWKDYIEAMKEYNHSISGVLRSTRPKIVTNDTVTIEAFYSFHREKLSEAKVREALAITIKKLFGAKVKVEIVLGKK
jgi:DNA polymerase-3 subunit gamma/tau